MSGLKRHIKVLQKVSHLRFFTHLAALSTIIGDIAYYITSLIVDLIPIAVF